VRENGSGMREKEFYSSQHLASKMTKILGSQGPASEKNKFIILALEMDEDTRGPGSCW
jgi:hypothetical protein